MSRRLITIVSVGALTFAVFLLGGGMVQQQADYAADAGISPPNRDATCPVRLDPDFAADAGLPCVLLDGGSFGDRNVSACSTRAAPATCERVSSGVIYAGDDPEEL